MATEHHLTVPRTARYYTLGELSPATTHVWFCLHGFGQLATYFGRKFTNLADGNTFVILPEGLSRSYLDGTYSRVGASWLTREDKEHEISDFLSYLNTLYASVLNGREPSSLHITVLGFSQGAAVACRWLNQPGNLANRLRVDRLILWAGYFPNGLRELIDPAKLAAIDTHYVYGRQDEYIVQMDDAKGYLNRIQADLPALKMTAFDGGHKVETEVLQQLVARSKLVS
ncbi:alpha/beta hydrolase [Spirosoma radiotolerans]|uniref:Phospholipase n=1 Tax=Spirosoma radiotolerans TaxID=1379870 RepID=A0A0E3V8N0_9BACT|nr:phospholipase [Spirosoma radiotolerans]AKD56902.1 phospholipase [Spirosoma radiotolerans]